MVTSCDNSLSNHTSTDSSGRMLFQSTSIYNISYVEDLTELDATCMCRQHMALQAGLMGQFLFSEKSLPNGCSVQPVL